MLKLPKLFMGLTVVVGLCLLVALAQTNGSLSINKTTDSKADNKNLLIGAVMENSGGRKVVKPVAQEFGCPCNDVRAGQYCSPSGYGCDPPPNPVPDIGCGRQGSGPGCDPGKCCTDIIIE